MVPKEPGPLAVGPNGDLYVADDARNEILERLPTERFQVVAGDGRPGFSGDGGLATRASLDQPHGIAVGIGGTIYFADSNNNRVRAVLPNGTITTVAGDGQSAAVGVSPTTGASATGTAIGPTTAIAIGPDGSVYLTSSNTVLELGTTGTLAMIADASNFLGVDQRFPDTSECDPDGLAFDGAGDLFMTCANTNDLLERSASGALLYRGILRPHDANAALASSPDGTVIGLWQSAVYRYTSTGQQLVTSFTSVPRVGDFWPTGVAVGADGTMYLDQDGTGGIGPPAIIEVSPNRDVADLWSH